jgi:hypothetical protein
LAITPEAIATVVKILTECNERELIATLNQVFEVYAKRFDGEGPDRDFGGRYSLVRSSFEHGEDEADGPYIEFLCSPGEPYWSEPWDEALDSGRCPICRVIVGCVNKLANCSVCGMNNIECT